MMKSPFAAAGTVLERWAARRIERFDRACRDAVNIQQRILMRLLRRARNTEWGRRYRFSEIRTIEEYRRRVPLIPYENAAPDWHRAWNGARNIAWPGHVKYFAMSSGTTAGNKYLPVTRDALRSNRRAGALLTAFLVRRFGAESLITGKSFYLGGSTTLQRKGVSFSGDASGIMLKNTPVWVRRRILPDPDTAAVSDWEDKIRRIAEQYPGEDVRILSACPSWAILLFHEVRNRTGRPPGEVWPNLVCFLSFGMAFEPYRNSFREAFGKPVTVLETYSSSEGGMTAFQDEEGAPMRLIPDNGVFFEFIPAEEMDKASPPRLHIGEVECGRDYALVLTTNGGIWAYPLGDVIRFESLDPPRIRFAGRTRINLNAFGEHVTLEMIEEAVAEACRHCNASVRDYTVVPLFPAPDHPKPVHRWIIEFERPPEDLDAFMHAIDNHLRNRSEDYDTHRKNDFGMAPPECVPAPPGLFYEWMKQRGQLGGQHKVPRVLTRTEEVRSLHDLMHRTA